MRRILHVIANLDVGGAEMDLISKTLVLKDRYRFAVATLKHRGTLADRLEDAGVRVFELGMRAAWDASKCAKLVDYVRREQIDLVHAHMQNAFWVAALLRLFRPRLPLVYTIQKEGTQAGVAERLVGRVLMPGAAAVVAPSESVSDTYRQVGLGGRNFEVIYNSIDFSRLSGGKDLLRQDFDVSGATLIGTVGRLLPIKGHRYLIAALPEIRKAVPGVRCAIVGEGPERRTLENLARQLGVADCVLWVGSRADIENFLPYLRVFVMPSVSEAFGIAAAEALAAGVPVVASAVGGLPEIVSEGQTGYLVKPSDPRALAARVIDILRDDALHARMRLAGQISVARFSAALQAERWSSLYERVLGGGGLRPGSARDLDLR